MSHESSPDQLLARTGWLRRLARELLDDPHAADDLVQDVLVAALEQPAGRVRRWDVWLPSVLRHKAARRRRSERRRRSREIGAARAETLPDTAAIVAEAALQRRVVGFVLELSEPYRSTVLLRFWEGRSPRRIAQQLGLSVDTVYSRLRRGLAMLRERLDRQDRDWRAVVAPFAVGRLAVWPGALGGLVMSMKSKVAVGVAVAVVATVSWMFLGGEPGQVGPLGVGDGPAAQPRQVELDSDARDRAESIPQDAGAAGRRALEDAFVVRGIVQRYDETPLPNVRVRARMIPGFDQRRNAALETVLQADADGRFAWPMPRPAQSVTMLFGQADPKVWSGYGQCRVLRDSAPPQDVIVTGSLLDLVVYGTVRDPDDEPVEGALLFNPYTNETCTTAADGRYELRSWSISSNATVYCRAAGFALVHADVGTGSKPGRVEHDIRLSAGATLRGRVVDEHGDGIGGVRMSLGHVFGRVGETAADGSFVVDCVDPGASRYSFLFAHADYQSKRVTVDSADLGRALVVTLESGIEVGGRVFAPDGAPLPGAEVMVFLPRSGGPSAISEDDGSFVCRPVPRGTLQVRVDADGMATHFGTLSIADDARGVPDLTINMEREHVLSGVVVDETGAPIGRRGGVVAKRGDRYFDAAGGRTDAAGRFELSGLPSGRVQLEVYGSELLRRTIDDVAVDQTDLEIVLQRAASLAGRVLDAATGEPVRKFVVRFVTPQLGEGDRGAGSCSSNWFSPGHSFQSADGGWSTTAVGGDEFRAGGLMGIEILADGYAPALARRVAAKVDMQPEDFVVRLRAPGAVRGRVLDGATGVAIEGARVRLFSDDRPLRFVGGVIESNAITAITDADGRFSIDGTPVGAVSLRVEHERYAWLRDGPFRVEPEAPVERLIQLSAGTSLRGTGAPDRTVVLEAVDVEAAPDFRAETTADGDGAFRFRQSLASGSYRLTSLVPSDGGGFTLLRAAASTDDSAEHAVTLAPAGTGGLRGVVGPSSTTAELRRVGERRWIRVPLDAGELRVSGLAPGTWELRGHGAFDVRAGAVTRVRASIR